MTADSIDDVVSIELQAMAMVLDWNIYERRVANLQDPETRALVDVGLLVIVDEETRKLLPPPSNGPASSGKGCGCGS